MTPTGNPWLTQPVTPAPVGEQFRPVPPPAPAPFTAAPAPAGPAVVAAALGPQPGVAPPPAAQRLPRRAVTVPADVWWLGVHGGAGEDTLALLAPGSAACGGAWPRFPAERSPHGDRLPVVLVARSNARGLTAAQRAVTEWAAGGAEGVDVLGLALVADAPGRLPRPLREFAALVAGGAPRVWHLPWVEAWRTGEEVRADTAPKEFRRLLEDVRHLAHTTTAPRGH